MTRHDLFEKYTGKCNEARMKYEEARKKKHENKNINPDESKLDELEQEYHAANLHLAQEILKDIYEMEWGFGFGGK